MFDLINDLSEMNNIYNQTTNNEIRGELKEKFRELQDKYIDRDYEYPQLHSEINLYWK